MNSSNQVLAMYDVRGIQDYIFRTSKLKEAIGASAIVEDLFVDALESASARYRDVYSFELEWCIEGEGPLPYNIGKLVDVQVLYIGGGNGYVIFRDQEVAVVISRFMARFVMERTYSLQLATAIVPKTDNYSHDYQELNRKMTEVKDSMVVSKPMGALPVMKVDKKTGYALIAKDSTTESKIKATGAEKVRKNMKLEEKQFDSYVLRKYEDSMLAVVHIDGNSMGQRIRQLVENIDDYTESVERMRKISYNINHSYKDVFNEMQAFFNERDAKKWGVLKAIIAGDDITYICRADIALATVEYFCGRISSMGMLGEEDTDGKYRFSVCAGIAYFHSHFPFNIAYDVAEACCDSAKERAKKSEYIDDEMIGNWLDFQFCRSIHAADLDRIREEEYVTVKGENLLRRPYYIPSEVLEKEHPKFRELRETKLSYTKFIEEMKDYVLNVEKNIPRSYVKELRDTYPLGMEQVSVLQSFLESRKRELPESMYFAGENGVQTALLYDALEVADYFQALEDIKEAK